MLLFCSAVYPVQVGFKLLAFDVRVASGLAFKAMRGNTLTRWAPAAAAAATAAATPALGLQQ
jgi:hypothetical protein